MGKKDEAEEVLSIGNVDEMIEYGTVERVLPVQLTNEERLEFGQELSESVATYERIEGAKKAAMQNFSASLKTEETNIKRCARIVAKGKVDKPVSVQVTKNFRTGTIKEVREDTGEVLFERPMSQSERQRGLTLK